MIDYCLELELTKDFFDNLNIEILIPKYVKNEILNSNKQPLIDKLSEIEYNQIGFFGFYNKNPLALGFGQGNFYSNEYDEFLKNTTKKHHSDRLISILAKINNAVFITSDNKIFKDAIEYNVYSIFIAQDQKSYNKAIKYSQQVYLKCNLTKDGFAKIFKNIAF